MSFPLSMWSELASFFYSVWPLMGVKVMQEMHSELEYRRVELRSGFKMRITPEHYEFWIRHSSKNDINYIIANLFRYVTNRTDGHYSDSPVLREI